MSLSTYHVILGVLILTISCKFSEYPLYSFKAFDSSIGRFKQIALSPDEDKIAIISFVNKTKILVCNHQDIFNFDGEKVCAIMLRDHQQRFIGWPSKTSGIYYSSWNSTLMKANSLCAEPEHLVKLPINSIP